MVAYGGGQVVKLQGVGLKRERVGGGKRQAIKGFSRNARKRMIFELRSIDYEAIIKAGYYVYFITLTIHSALWFEKPDFRLLARALDNFRRVLNHHLGKTWGAYWKKEPTGQKVPHFHLILITKHRWRVIKELVSYLWPREYAITFGFPLEREEVKKMFRASVQVVYENNPSRVLDYVAKYINKEFQVDWENPGKFWGVLNKEFIEALKTEERIGIYTSAVFHPLRRFIVNYLYSRGFSIRIYSRYAGITVLYSTRAFYEACKRYFEYLVSIYGNGGGLDDGENYELDEDLLELFEYF